MKVAIVGCAHGELEKIYETIEYVDIEHNFKTELLLCCGDFQATRNLADLNCMAIPQKFHDLCTFYKYYSGEKIAPIMTILIGGNHEASNYLQELPYGGWIAPNIYYLGYAGVVIYNGLRIAGISGIHKGYDYFKGHFEFPPYNVSEKRSVYHLRQLEVFRLKQLSGNIDVVMSHEWPRSVYYHGNYEQLIKFKPGFGEQIEKNTLGNSPCEDLLKTLKPCYWFAAHLHCRFTALFPHEDSDKFTKFLALDKCLPERRFLQVLDMYPESSLSDGKDEIKQEESSNELKIGQAGNNAEQKQERSLSDDNNTIVKFQYDLEWLAILYNTNHLINVRESRSYMPNEDCTNERFNFTPTMEEQQFILKKFNNSLTIPKNFVRTADTFNADVAGSKDTSMNHEQPGPVLNPQTEYFCNLLGIDDPLKLAMFMNGQDLNSSIYSGNDTTSIDDSTTDIDSFIVSDISLNESSSINNNNNSSSLSMNESNPEELILSEYDIDENDDVEEEYDEFHGISSNNTTVNSNESYGLSNCTLNEGNDEKNESLTENSLNSTTSSQLTNQSNLNTSNEVVNKSIKTTSTPETKTPDRKFIRRNQSIYSNSNND